ncbi:MAG: hypothetical protein SPJ16_03455, partial [Helicobacter sp.]|uniref:ADP-ribosyltransferase-containing protein n=1 Tax=Helicobacter sp. TaxID=218 RepID=UPI002A91096B
TLEQPQRIILQNDGALIFARNFGEEKYFTSVARNDNGEWIIRSNAPKAENGLNNKISAGGKEIYNSQAVNQINAHNPYDDIAKSNIKLDTNIIPQQTLESTMQKFNYDERKAKDLLEWHKDSSPLTKDENGLPKVFYHGTTLSNMKRLHNKELKKPFEVFNTKDNSVSNFSIGNWFSNDKNLAKNYADDDEGNFIYEVFLNIKKPFIMEKELTQEKIKEIDKIFKFTKKDKERGLRAVENLKQAKAELKESGFELLQYDRESVKIRHIESGKEFSTPLYNLKKENLHESIRAYEADLKHNPNLDESLQELKELDSLLKKDSPTLYEAGFEKEFFKNETELYILAAARENEKLQEVVGGHYGVYGGYGRMYQTARIYPLQQFYKKAGYDGILFNDREIVAFDSNQIKHIDNKGSYTDTKGNITKTKPKNKESTHKYFNENSPNIMYANPQHLGAGVLSGTAAGIETDENGNIVGFNPAKFAAGFLGGVAGSKAVTQGFKHLKNNPQLKEAVARELANTLAQGFDKAKAKYPLLSMLEPRYIVQNEKGRIVQAKSMLKLAEKESQKVQLKTYKTLKKYNIESLEIAQEQEYKDFVADVWDKKGYEKAPNILKIATLPQELKNALGVKFDEVFLTKKDLSHFRTARKANYNQALSENEILEIPSVIANAKNAYIDTRHKNFFIVFADKQDNTKINFIHFNTDELGNYIITTKKTNKEVLNDRHYKQVGSGIEPHIP